MTRLENRIWTQLVEKAELAAADPEHPHPELRTAQADTRGMVIPAESYADRAAFVALAALSRAYGAAAGDRRRGLSAGLRTLAGECRGILGERLPTKAPAWLARADCGR